MKTLLILLSITLSLIFVSCSKKGPVYDGSSEEAAAASVEQMFENLPPDKKEKFQAAYLKICMEAAGSSLWTGGPTDAMKKKLMLNLDGKSVDEIIALAKLDDIQPEKITEEYITVKGPSKMGRLGISKIAAIELWGDYTKGDIVAPAEQALIFKPKGFIIGVQIWKGKVAQIRVSKGEGMPKFDEDELFQLCGKMTGSGKWKKEIGYDKVRQDGQVVMLGIPQLPRFRTSEFEDAVQRTEKKTRARAIEGL